MWGRSTNNITNALTQRTAKIIIIILKKRKWMWDNIVPQFVVVAQVLSHSLPQKMVAQLAYRLVAQPFSEATRVITLVQLLLMAELVNVLKGC